VNSLKYYSAVDKFDYLPSNKQIIVKDENFYGTYLPEIKILTKYKLLQNSPL